jgi:ornithine carbamoyltransferase
MSTATLSKRDYPRVDALSPDDLTALLDLAEAFKRDPLRRRKALRGQSVACYFSKPSTRTRVSFEAAAFRLGALPIMMRPDELQLGRGEPIADTARVLSAYCAAIVIRTFAQADVDEMAEYASVPVVNALTDDHHPCQALADLLTLREHFGDLRGLKVAYVGADNNVARSLADAGELAGMDVVVCSPPADPFDAVRGAQCVYTDVWVSMGEDEQRDALVRRLEPYRVTEELMAAAGPQAVFMHCLPAHRGEEVVGEVIDGPRSLVFPQAANRLPTEQAVLYALTTGDWGTDR